MNRDLDLFANPRSVALIGATERPNSVGAGLVSNLWEGRNKRKLFWVNSKAKEIRGERAHGSVLEINDRIDLAVIAVPAESVPSVVEECCRKKVGSIAVISAGFSEIGAAGRERQDQIRSMVRRAEIPLLGPNCLGFLRPGINLNASFAPFTPAAGGIAFISQSGALMNSVIDRSDRENYGFSWMISYGNGADLSLVELLELVGRDQQTRVIALYLEGLERGREFMEAARAVTENKPVIALKAGRTEEGRKAAASHTASLVGADRVYRAAFKQSGIMAVDTLEDLFDRAKALSWQPQVKGGVGVVTNGGGMGVLAADAAAEMKLALPELAEETSSKIGRKGSMPRTVNFGNPLDIVGDAGTDRYRLAMQAMAAQKEISVLVVIQTKQTMTDIQANMEALAEVASGHPKKAFVSVCLPGKFSHQAIGWLEKNGIPNYSDPSRALKAVRALVHA